MSFSDLYFITIVELVFSFAIISILSTKFKFCLSKLKSISTFWFIFSSTTTFKFWFAFSCTCFISSFPSPYVILLLLTLYATLPIMLTFSKFPIVSGILIPFNLALFILKFREVLTGVSLTFNS